MEDEHPLSEAIAEARPTPEEERKVARYVAELRT